MKREQEPTTSLVVECEFPEAVERVWRALTEPEWLAAWLMPNDMRAERGHRFRFRPEPRAGSRDGDGDGDGDGDETAVGEIDCEVLECEPERRLRLAWRTPPGGGGAQGAPLESVVTFELAAREGGGTHLRVVHDGLPARETGTGGTSMCLARAA